MKKPTGDNPRWAIFFFVKSSRKYIGQPLYFGEDLTHRIPEEKCRKLLINKSRSLTRYPAALRALNARNCNALMALCQGHKPECFCRKRANVNFLCQLLSSLTTFKPLILFAFCVSVCVNFCVNFFR